MPQPPKNVKRGDQLLAQDFNKVLQELRRLGKLVDANRVGTVKPLRADQVWFGLVTDAGPSAEADYTDERYWVKRAKIDLDELDNAETAITFAAKTGVFEETVTATNLTEVITGNHRLPVDTPVILFRFFDDGTKSIPRYIFWTRRDSNELFPVDVSQTGGSGGNKTTKTSYTYTATDAITAVELGTVLSPVFNTRTATGAHVAATKGTGYFDEAGNFVLYQINEVPDVGEC